MSSDPRLKDVARNMALSLDVLHRNPEPGAEIARFYALATDVDWWELRDAFAELASAEIDESKTLEDFWVSNLTEDELPVFESRAEKFRDLVLEKTRNRAFFKDTADFLMRCPDVMMPGAVYELSTFPECLMERVCATTAAHHTAHLVGHPELDVEAMRGGLTGALRTVLSAGADATKFSSGALGHRPDYSGEDDPVFVMPMSTDSQDHRLFFQVRLRKNGDVSWSVRIYTRGARATSPFDLVAGLDEMDTDAAAKLFGADDVLETVQEHPLPIPAYALENTL